jgi:predicted RNA binding protein YcfA (HicA-like mRNA interferase family)
MTFPVDGRGSPLDPVLVAELAEAKREAEAMIEAKKTRTTSAAAGGAGGPKDDERERKTRAMQAKVAQLFAVRETLASAFKESQDCRYHDRALRDAGATLTKTTGSHKKYNFQGTTITVPYNSTGSLPIGTCHAIADQILANVSFAKV